MIQDFAVIVTAADEGAPQLELCLSNLRKHHPNIPVRVISDGVDDPSYPKLCKKYKVDYELGTFLKRIETGGLWWKRVLEAGLSYKKPLFFKIDPDTKFHKPVQHWPKYPISGSRHNAGEENDTIQGGCQSFKKGAAEKILNSGILKSDDLFKPHLYRPRGIYQNNWIPSGYFTTDYSLMYAIKKLSIEYGNWEEIGCAWLHAPNNSDLRFSVTHPHKVDNHDRGVPKDTPLHIFTTCKGRLSHLKQSLPTWLEAGVHVTVVDYDCPDGTEAWVKKHYPKVKVVKVKNKPKFHLANARNTGIKGAPDGWWCFFDADIKMNSGWAAEVRKYLKKGYYHNATPLQWGQTGSHITHSDDFKKTQGYDEVIKGWAPEDLDFYMSLRQANIRPGAFPSKLIQLIQHGDELRGQFYDAEKEVSKTIFDTYYLLKMRFISTHYRLPNPVEKQKLLDEALVESKVDPVNNGVCYPPFAKKKPDGMTRTGEKTDNPVPSVIQDTTESKQDSQENYAGTESSSHTRSDVSNETGAGDTPSANLYDFAVPESLPYHTTITIANEVCPPMDTICVVNASTLNLDIKLSELCRIGEKYLREAVSKYYPHAPCRIIPSRVILPRTPAIVLMDDARHGDALGYKDQTPDHFPLGRVFVRKSLVNGVPTTLPFTHELAEFRTDPYNNMTACDSYGLVHAFEIVDPVDGDFWLLDNWEVANFVTPNWFRPHQVAKTGRLDYMGKIKQSFEITPLGFACVLENGQWTQKYGSMFKERDSRSSDLRKHRRGVRAANLKAQQRPMYGHYKDRWATMKSQPKVVH